MNVLVNTTTTRNVGVNTATGRQSVWISCKAGVGLVMVLACSVVQDMLGVQVYMCECAWLCCRGGTCCARLLHCYARLSKTSCVHI